MLDYTKAAFKKTVDDFKRLDYIRNVVTQALYVVYLAYAIFAPAGELWANIPLFLLSLGYFVVFLVSTTSNATQTQKRVKQICKTVYNRCKQLIKLFTLIVMVYGIYATTTNFTPFSVVLAALMIVGWVLQVMFEVILKYFLNRANFILEGMEADYENMLKPVKSVGNFFKKVAGKEIEPEKEKSKNRLWLDDQVAQTKAAKKQEKLEERERRKQERIEKFATHKSRFGKEKTQEIDNERIPAPALLEKSGNSTSLPSADKYEQAPTQQGENQ